MGSVQDGGVPHLGCECETCEKARNNPDNVRYVDSIILKSSESEGSVKYLFSASPDIRFQVPGNYLDGIFVADDFYGNIGGLPHLGQAVMNAEDMTVFCPDFASEFMMLNDPFRRMSDRENINLTEIEDGKSINTLCGSVTPVKVPHCGSGSHTFAYRIEGDDSTLFYARDFDEITDTVEQEIENADIAIIDGCFWSSGEIDRYPEVAHVTMQESIEALSDVDTDIYYTYMNHTNPVLVEGSDQRKKLESKGMSLVERGMEFDI